MCSASLGRRTRENQRLGIATTVSGRTSATCYGALLSLDVPPSPPVFCYYLFPLLSATCVVRPVPRGHISPQISSGYHKVLRAAVCIFALTRTGFKQVKNRPVTGADKADEALGTGSSAESGRLLILRRSELEEPQIGAALLALLAYPLPSEAPQRSDLSSVLFGQWVQNG